MDFKTGKLIEIVREFLGNNRNRFEINGVDVSRAVFMWRKKETKFKPIPKGSYKIVTENNVVYLQVDDDIKNKTYEYQIIYNNTLESSTYDEDFPELDVLVEKHNLLVKDIGKIKNLLTTTGVKVDTVKMSQILTPLEPNTIWGADENGVIQNFPIGNLNSKYESMVKTLKLKIQNETSNNLEEALKNITTEAIKKINEIENKADTLKNEFNILSNNEKKELMNKAIVSTNELNTLVCDLKIIIENKKQEVLKEISQAVLDYIKNNQKLLKGNKGDGIKNINSIGDNQIEIEYGDNKTEIVKIKTAGTQTVFNGEIICSKTSDEKLFDLPNDWKIMFIVAGKEGYSNEGKDTIIWLNIEENITNEIIAWYRKTFFITPTNEFWIHGIEYEQNITIFKVEVLK